LKDLLDKEELWWRQRAKVEWLKSGDRNTRFFHACASDRKWRNHVGSITDENGNIWENSRDMGDAFVKYFTNLFTQGPDGDFSLCLQPITCRVIDVMKMDLGKSFTVEEIEVALFLMAPLKAPGLDGLNACFFQQNCPTMRDKVVEGMLDRCDQLDFVRFVGIARCIWLWRSEVIHGGFPIHPKLIVQQAVQAGGNFQTITAGRKGHTSSTGELTMKNWKAPFHDCLKINWDA
jgi:hypothetical protein